MRIILVVFVFRVCISLPYRYLWLFSASFVVIVVTLEQNDVNQRIKCKIKHNTVFMVKWTRICVNFWIILCERDQRNSAEWWKWRTNRQAFVKTPAKCYYHQQANNGSRRENLQPTFLEQQHRSVPITWILRYMPYFLFAFKFIFLTSFVLHTYFVSLFFVFFFGGILQVFA